MLNVIILMPPLNIRSADVSKYSLFQHDGKPYCNNPCYSALFGPGGFGRGGAESHKY